MSSFFATRAFCGEEAGTLDHLEDKATALGFVFFAAKGNWFIGIRKEAFVPESARISAIRFASAETFGKRQEQLSWPIV